MMLFQPGDIVATRAVMAAIKNDESVLRDFLERHLSGDWGAVGHNQVKANARGLRGPNTVRLESAYSLPEKYGGREVWVMTEWDRSVTTILFPEDY